MSLDGLEWENQRIFLAVLRSGSLSGAARLLGISQATARRRIEKLEAGIGVSLFVRTPSGLVPSEAARELGEHAQAMDVAARAFNRRAGAGALAGEGKVRLTCGELFGAQVIPGLLVDVRQALPGVALELSVDDSLQALSQLEADIAVRLMRPTEARVVTRRLGALRVGLYASAQCIARHGLPSTGEDLAGLPLIGPDRREADRCRLVEQGVFSAGMRFDFASDSHPAQFAALVAGLGFAACPAQLAEPAGLVRVLEGQVGFEVDVWIAMHHDLRRVPRVVAVFDGLSQALEGWLGV